MALYAEAVRENMLIVLLTLSESNAHFRTASSCLKYHLDCHPPALLLRILLPDLVINIIVIANTLRSAAGIIPKRSFNVLVFNMLVLGADFDVVPYSRGSSPHVDKVLHILSYGLGWVPGSQDTLTVAVSFNRSVLIDPSCWSMLLMRAVYSEIYFRRRSECFY